MKKLLYVLTLAALSPAFMAQTDVPATLATQPGAPAPFKDDRKVRFGLRVTPQPTWLQSGDKNNIPAGAKFGFGFGLNLEFRFSEVTALLTGIGGDMEGGKYTFRNDATYQPSYILDESNAILEPAKDNVSAQRIPGNTLYTLKERSISSTHVTIPLILKLSTREHMGLKYFGMFGGEVAVRIKSQATDSYHSATTWDAAGVPTTGTGPGSLDQINLSKEGGLPLRVGMNVGLGAEYRIAETTSLFMNINYFRSFLNMFESTSKNTFYYNSVTGNTATYKFIQQNLSLSAIRINIGIMF